MSITQDAVEVRCRCTILLVHQTVAFNCLRMIEVRCLRLQANYSPCAPLEMLLNDWCLRFPSAEEVLFMPFLAELFSLKWRNERECQALSIGLTDLKPSDYGRWLNRNSKPATGGVRRVRLHAHWHLWWRSGPGSRNLQPHPTGVWTYQSAARLQWVARPSDRPAAL